MAGSCSMNSLLSSTTLFLWNTWTKRAQTTWVVTKKLFTKPENWREYGPASRSTSKMLELKRLFITPWKRSLPLQRIQMNHHDFCILLLHICLDMLLQISLLWCALILLVQIVYCIATCTSREVLPAPEMRYFDSLNLPESWFKALFAIFYYFKIW